MLLANNIDLQSGLIGGLIIGASSTVLMFLHGKVTGISGILEGMIIFKPHDGKKWCFSYVAGLLSSGALLIQYFPQAFNTVPTLNNNALVAAGVITGFGARLGSGCTSGHGICGLPRLSLRSLAAVGIFMTTGALTAYTFRETSWNSLIAPVGGEGAPVSLISALAPSAVAVTASILAFSRNAEAPKVKADAPWYDHLVSYLSGIAVGVGLGISGMCNPDRVINFLNFTNESIGWDPSLMAVMGGGVLLNLFTFKWMSEQECPPSLHPEHPELSKTLKMGNHPHNLIIDMKLILGSALFGVGWGLGGVCPGPALVSLGSLSGSARLFVPAIIGGVALHEVIKGLGSSSKKNI